MRYCAVVVWYDPEPNAENNILSYMDAAECVYVVDNSVGSHADRLSRMPFREKCVYLPLGENRGLAAALNVGCRRAAQDGFTHVLTMDQDSRFEPGAALRLCRCMEETGGRYVIVSPNLCPMLPDENGGSVPGAPRWGREERLPQNWVITSGSLMSLRAFAEAGGFDEALFIDHVDIDLCIRLRQNGGEICMLGEAVLLQQFGNARPRRLLWKTVYPTFSGPVRTYYLFRNQKYLEKKYGRDIRPFIGVELWRFAVKILLFEDRKAEKLRMMARGLRDARRGQMGRYAEGRREKNA